MKTYIRFVGAGLFCISLFSCFQVIDGTLSQLASSDTFNYTSQNPYYTVSFGQANRMTVTVRGAAGKSLYLVKANTNDTVVASENTGKAFFQNERNIGENPAVISEKKVLNDNPAIPIRLEHAEAAAFNANPPPIVADDILARRSNVLDVEKRASVNYGANAGLAVGATKQFWVQKADDSWTQINTTLRAIGQYCYVWVENLNFTDSASTDNDNKLTSTQINALRDKFDGSAANGYKDGIFKNVSNIFGYEYGGGTGGDGGKDGDQHISILIYDIDDDHKADQTGGTFGFFWGKDYYDDNQLSTQKSNKAEMFYLDSHFTDRYPEAMYLTLAHEYQHMIHFNQKSIKQGLSSPSWYDEMCAMVAEDLVAKNILDSGYNPLEDGPQRRFNKFLYHYDESGVTDWFSTYPEVLKSYASSYAFGAYLARNYGGAKLFAKIVTNNKVGTASITKALADSGFTGETFETVFKKYGQALVYTKVPTGLNLKTFNKESVNVDFGDEKITYTLDPIDFDGITYSAGTPEVNYTGLSVFNLNWQAALRPYGHSVHSATSWTNITGDVQVTLTAPAVGVEFTLMVK